MRFLSLAFVFALALAADAAAQEPTTLPDDAALHAVDLPGSLARIRRQMDRLPETREERDLLRLNYYIRVYGRAPELNVVEGFDLHTGPVPYGATSHTDLLNAATPRRWRPGAVTFSIPR